MGCNKKHFKKLARQTDRNLSGILIYKPRKKKIEEEVGNMIRKLKGGYY